MAQPPLARPTRPPRALNVVRPPLASAFAADVDWRAWYLTDEDDMGEGCEQGVIIRLLLAVLHEHCRRRPGWTEAFVGADNFFAWVPSEPLVRVSPDVYVLRGPVPDPLPAMWQTWREGHAPPLLAFEIVSADWRKDYEQNPEKYAQLGVEELCIFDPEAGAHAAAGGERRVPLQLYRRAPDGAFVCAYEGGGPARSEVLDAWVVVTSDGSARRLRLAEDAAGQRLVPTADEARRAAEEARDQERRARADLEAELAELRRRLAARQGPPGGPEAPPAR